MKPNLKLKAYLLVCLASVMLAVTSCKKEEKETSPDRIEVTENEIPTSVLKAYYSSLTNIDTAQLVYNEETTYFQWHGVNQINRADLTFAYKINHKEK